MPSGPRTSPWWIAFGKHASERSPDALLQLEVRTVIRAAQHVRDREIEIVDHRGELVRRGAVRAQQGGAAAKQPHGALGVALGRLTCDRSRRRLRVELSSLALAQGSLLEGDVEPPQVLEDRLLPARHGSRGIGVVDPEDEHAASLVGEAAIRHRGERVAEVERARRARREADANAHASMVTCPG